jgi:hypothetical protein
MPRRCECCNSAEILPTLNQRLRAGEPYAVLSREYGLSEDSLRRHHKAHVRGEGATPIDLGERLQLLWDRADELYRHALTVSDTRAAIDALSRLTQVTENLSKIQVRQSSAFESMTTAEQVAFISNTPHLFTAWCDFCIRTAGLPENFGQPSDAVK